MSRVQTNEVVELDAFVPDYSHQCENCEQSPVVMGVKKGKSGLSLRDVRTLHVRGGGLHRSRELVSNFNEQRK